jgi:DNA polymerase III subunit gamma/tau
VKQGGARACDKIAAVSLYRTWRPKSFSDLVGQDAVVRTLRTALTSGKLAHAYLFSGPRGSGKTSAAKILARCIDCERGPTAEPDNTCENCRAMLAGTALDVVEIDAASNRGIDEIRALRDAAKFAPASMRMKVFIIDEAHMLTREGANAFLKTLEEPPPHVVFILATTAPESLPPTILSRCQRYAFRRIPVGVMVDRMREIAAAEDIATDEDALAAIAYRADGGLRDALTMLEQVAAYAGPSGTAVTAATVDAAFGITGRHFARGLVDAILGGRASDALRLVDEASDAGADMLGLIRSTIGEYRNLMVARIDAGLLSRDLAQSDAAAAIALADATPQPKIVRGLRLLADALAAGRLSGNPRLELETAVLRLIVQNEDPSLEALATRVALLEGGPVSFSARLDLEQAALPASTEPAGAGARAEQQQGRATIKASKREAPAKFVAEESAPPLLVSPALAPPALVAPALVEPAGDAPSEPPAGEPTLQQVRSLWDQIRLRAEEAHKPMRSPLARATVDSVHGGALTIGIPDSIQEAIVREKLEILENAIEAVLRVRLRVILRSRVTAGTPRTPITSAHRAGTESASESAPASAADAGGEFDLLAYARKKLGGTETT